MAVTYKKLWHILLDRDMKKKDLQETAELTKNGSLEELFMEVMDYDKTM